MQPAVIYRTSEREGPLCQGEFLSYLVQARLSLGSMGADEPVVDFITHPLAVVMSQDCDLEQDFKARCGQAGEIKKLQNILFCEVETAEELKGRKDEINSTVWSQIKINKHERYQFFQKILPDQDLQQEGLDELGMDFKRYFTVPADEVYERLKVEIRRRCRLVSPYLEHLSCRFAYFLSRVSLPIDHASDPVAR